jgi:hypothetical protein
VHIKNGGFVKQQKWLVIVLAILVVLGSASGWIYNLVKVDPQKPSQTELNNLQISFMKTYGTSATVTEMINPKIYEVAWTGSDGSKNVSINVGGVWALLASIPNSSTTTTPSKITP